MGNEEYKQLERLVGKLSHEIGVRYCIIPEYIQDLCYIATFDHDGKKVKEVYGLDIQDAVNKLKTQTNEQH